MSVVNEIDDERHRQVRGEGWDAAHDDDHGNGELARAAMAYCQSATTCLADTSFLASRPPSYWPFAASWWKPKNARRDLIRAGALIVAEIERIDRDERAKAR